MARDEITVLLPVEDATKSIETAEITETTVTQANGIAVKKAFENKNNTLTIVVYNSASADKTVTLKAGNMHPNATLLGDLSTTVTTAKKAVIKIQNPSRFENQDGTLNIDFASGFTGTIYAVAKRAGLKPVD